MKTFQLMLMMLSFTIVDAQAGINEWTYVGLAPEEIVSVAISPVDTSIIYASARDDPWDSTAEGGLFKTYDHGLTWDTLGFRHSHVFDVALDPQHPETVWVANWTAGLWRSTDGGLTWENHSDGITYGPPWLGPSEVRICPTDPLRMLVAIYNAEGPSPAYRSDDGGMSWTMIPELGYLAPSKLRFDPTGVGLAYCFLPSLARFALSEDCGASFLQWDLPMLSSPADLQVAPDHAGRLWWAAGSHGAWTSSDSGHTWLQGVNGFQGSDSAVYCLAPIGNAEDTLVIATNTGAFIWLSEDAVVPMTQGWPTWLPPARVWAMNTHQLGEVWATKQNTGLYAYTFTDSSTSVPRSRSAGSPVLGVYPNPAREILNISLPQVAPAGCEVCLYNLVGQKVFRRSVQAGDRVVSLGLPFTLAAGTYYLGVTFHRPQDRLGFNSLSKIVILK